MPFTFAHPAAVLPLLNKKKQWFSATGLIVGSMAPDFESFFTFGGEKYYSHIWRSIPLLDVPLGILVAFLFHQVIREVFIVNAPAFLYSRFAKYKQINWAAYFNANKFKVISSIFIGIITHFLWDAVTHLNLRDPDSIESTYKVFGHRLYIIIQYFCSLLGLVIVFYSMSKIKREPIPPTRMVSYIYWFWVLLCTILFTVIIFVIRSETYIDMVYIIKIVISALMYSLLLVSFVYKSICQPIVKE